MRSTAMKLIWHWIQDTYRLLIKKNGGNDLDGSCVSSGGIQESHFSKEKKKAESMTFSWMIVYVADINTTWFNTKDKWKGDDDHHLTISGDLIMISYLTHLKKNKYARVSIETNVISQSRQVCIYLLIELKFHKSKKKVINHISLFNKILT